MSLLQNVPLNPTRPLPTIGVGIITPKTELTNLDVVRISEIFAALLRELRGICQSSIKSRLPDDKEATFRINSLQSTTLDRELAIVAVGESFETQQIYIENYKDQLVGGTTQLPSESRNMNASATVILQEPKGVVESSINYYNHALEMVASYSDIIFVVGAPEKDHEFTTQVERWVDSRKPIIFINSADEQIDLMHYQSATIQLRLVANQVPTGSRQTVLQFLSSKVVSKLEIHELSYFKEKTHNLTFLGVFWKMFRDIVMSPLKVSLNFRIPSPNALAKIWSESPPLPREVNEKVDRITLMHISWADHLARYYANLYRSAYTVCYLLTPLAVAMALVPVFFKTDDTHSEHPLVFYSVCTELFALSTILLLVFLANWNGWHRKYLSYRYIVEYLRAYRTLSCLNCVPRTSEISAYSEKDSWVENYLQRVIAEVGMVTARFDESYLNKCRSFLISVIDGSGQIKNDKRKWTQGEIAYHTDYASKLKTFNHRLHLIEVGSFCVAMVGCVLHFFLHEPILMFIAAVCPAIGASIAAILSTGELPMVSQNGMLAVRRYELIKKKLLDLQSPEILALTSVAGELGETISAEMSYWKGIFASKEVRLS